MALKKRSGRTGIEPATEGWLIRRSRRIHLGFHDASSQPLMDRLNQAQPSDGLSAMLAALRVQTTIFCRSEMSAPWGFAVKAHGRSAFHLVLDGHCWLDVSGVPEPLEMTPGDIVVLARGPEHQLRSDRAARVEWLDDILERTPPRMGRLRYGENGVRTDLICGVLELENPTAVPLLNALPQVAHIKAADASTGWLAPLIELLRAEVGSFEPGADSVAARIADILLLQAIRSALRNGGELPQLFDRQVGHALRLLRDEPQQQWTADELARRVSASRASLAKRFKRSTGASPMRYLTELRMASAARHLRQGNSSLAEIASAVGYGSEAALSKAFLREMGVSPRAYRLAARADVAAGTPSRPRSVPKRRRSTAA